MSLGEHRPANAAPGELRWAPWLRRAFEWYPLVFLGSILLDTNSLPLHLTGPLQRIADIAVTAEFVLFLPVGFILVVAAMKRNPTTSWPFVWGIRLLVTSVFGLGVLLAYGRITALMPEWQRTTTETLALTMLGVLMCALLGVGLTLVVVALIGSFRLLARSRHRRRSASTGV